MAADAPIAHTLRLIDAALRTLGPHRLVDEHVFRLDREVSAPSYHRYVLAHPGPTQLPAWSEVTTAGTSFYLDRSAEIPEWSYDWIQANPTAFEEEIRVLLSSQILVEHHGTCTVLRLFSSTGVQLRQFTFRQGWGLTFFHHRRFKLYPPLFC